jgi:hypothetical protein
VRLAEIAGVERKIHFFAMDLPHSDTCFVQAYPAETAEAFCDGHNAAFSFVGSPIYGDGEFPLFKPSKGAILPPNLLESANIGLTETHPITR